MNIKIGAKIKVLRKRDDITQGQLAEILDVSNQAISRWESESGYPKRIELYQKNRLLQEYFSSNLFFYLLLFPTSYNLVSL